MQAAGVPPVSPLAPVPQLAPSSSGHPPLPSPLTSPLESVLPPQTVEVPEGCPSSAPGYSVPTYPPESLPRT